MRFWWVNHKQTFRHEFDGEYVWAPKRKRNGSRNRYYDFLREIVPGDLVFSYAHAQIQGVGIASSYCYTCPRPAEFGHIGEVWDVIGWRVDVKFRRFSRPVRPKEHIDLIERLVQRERWSPLKASGEGLQHIYLTSISRELARAILGLAGATDWMPLSGRMADLDSPPVETVLVGQQEWEDVEQRRIGGADIPQTIRTALIQARVGQGLFKSRVFQLEKVCRLTFVTNPAHLIASHIKPWREASNEERLSGANGLMLTPTADHLFDRGFISFDDSGDVLIADVADRVSLKRMGLDPDRPPRPIRFNSSEQRHFLEYHRKEIFLGSQ